MKLESGEWIQNNVWLLVEVFHALLFSVYFRTLFKVK